MMKTLKTLIGWINIVCFAFSACLTPAKRAQRCAQEFPCVTESKVVIRDSFHLDTLRESTQPIPISTVYLCPASDTPSVHIVVLPCQCPPHETITKTHTIYRDSITTVRDSAVLFALHAETNTLKTLLRKEKRHKHILLGMCLSLFVLGLIFVVLIYRRKQTK